MKFIIVYVSFCNKAGNSVTYSVYVFSPRFLESYCWIYKKWASLDRWENKLECSVGLSIIAKFSVGFLLV